jgi:xylulokinase
LKVAEHIASEHTGISGDPALLRFAKALATFAPPLSARSICENDYDISDRKREFGSRLDQIEPINKPKAARPRRPALNFLGIDIGTSAVKAVLVDERQAVLAEASAPVTSRQPRPGWSEQDPGEWWQATESAVAALRADAAADFAAIAALGLSGQMHAALLLDAADEPIRPAIIWNDGRAAAECRELEAAVAGLPEIAGIGAMPGFTAPKLLWLRKNEPGNFARARRVSLAKDYVRLKLTGEFATDMADAAGTLFLDEAARTWSAPILAASGVTPPMMPRLLEGTAAAGRLRPQMRSAWGIEGEVVVAAGAGDAAAGAIGIGAIGEGDSFISLGTSSQYFVTRDRYEPKPATLIHAFAHALPERWFEMAAMLNGASVLDWAARFLGGDIPGLLARTEERFKGPSPVLFLPYLAGERTPHDDPDARAGFFNLDNATVAEDLVQAVLEGVAFSLCDAQIALQAAGQSSAAVAAIGGGARSAFWLKLIASAIGLPVLRLAGSDKGPAYGAARLARLALTGEAPEEVCVKPRVVETIEPDAALHAAYGDRLMTYQALYRSLRRAREARADPRRAASR